MTTALKTGASRAGRYALIGAAAILASYGLLVAADHDEAPLVRGDRGADIADLYAFRSPANPDNVVLVLTLSDVSPPPEIELGRSAFDPDVLYQFKFDQDGDAVEDLVIQAFVTGNIRNQVMHFRGPAVPEVTGADARVVVGQETGSVRVSATGQPITVTRGGMTVFAGVRDDPFFFDVGQFLAILAGQAGGFNDPGTDGFAGLNVYAIVVELPIAALGDPSTMTVWSTTNRM